jgi:chromosome segregation ATPase
MTERLDRIEAQLATNTANITDLITLSRNVLQAAQLNAEAITELRANASELRARASETDDRFNILISEMRADRRATRQAFQALLLQLAEVNGRVNDLEQAG